MDRVDAFINSLLHGESRYDPVKAHQYYLRTRELKGRRNVSDLKTQNQKEGWQFVKSEVEKDRKASFTKASDANKAAVMKIRSDMQRRTEDLQKKIKSLGLKTPAAKKEREKLQGELKTALDNAKTAYQQVRDQIKAKFETELNTEFESIKSNVR